MWTRHRGYKSYYGRNAPKNNWAAGLFSFFKSKTKRKRDYWQKSYRNPYFLNKKWSRRTKAPRLKLTIGALAILGTFGILLFHPYFNITQIEIAGNEKISKDEIRSIIDSATDRKKFFFFSNRNIFLINTEELAKKIKSDYILASLEIKKDYPQKIEIIIQEKEAAAILQIFNDRTSQYKYYLLDKNGEVLQETSADNLINQKIASLPRLQKNENEKTIKIADEMVSKATGEFVFYLNQNVPKQNNIILSFITLADDEGQVLNLVTTEGWKIIVDRQNDWAKQLHILNVLLREKIKDNRQNLKYIDVRYENRAFFQ